MPNYFQPFQQAYVLPRPYVHTTEADHRLAKEMNQRKRLKAQGRAVYAPDALTVQPPGSTPFIQTGSVAVADMVINERYELISFAVPPGCWGVLKNRSHWFDGSGFVEGSDILTWGVSIGDGWLFDEGAMRYTIGPDHGGEITADGGGYLLRPNVTVKYYVTAGPSLPDFGGTVLARLRGWYVSA